MGIVIGFGTVATLGSVCAVSASWGESPNSQRLFCLNGLFTPIKTISKPTFTANLTIYSSASGPEVDISASSGCSDWDVGGDLIVDIAPASCGDDVAGGIDSKGMYVTSYSYSREDINLPGQESWALTQWKKGPDDDDKVPTKIIRGISEGQGTSNSGITFDGEVVPAATGNVSAGGMGRSDIIQIGIVSKVGKGASTGTETGQGSVSVQLTPLWI